MFGRPKKLSEARALELFGIVQGSLFGETENADRRELITAELDEYGAAGFHVAFLVALGNFRTFRHDIQAGRDSSSSEAWASDRGERYVFSLSRVALRMGDKAAKALISLLADDAPDARSLASILLIKHAMLQPGITPPRFSPASIDALQAFMAGPKGDVLTGDARFLTVAALARLGDRQAGADVARVARAADADIGDLETAAQKRLLLDIASPGAPRPIDAAAAIAASSIAASSPVESIPAGVPAAAVAFCPRCGAARAADFRFCPACGQDLGSIATSVSSPQARSFDIRTDPEYEFLEFVDHATARPKNLLSEDLVRFVFLRHSWPGGIEEKPIGEWALSRFKTPENATDRRYVQELLDEWTAALVSEGWQLVGGAHPWFTRSLRRAVPSGATAAPFFSAGDAAAAREVRAHDRVPNGYWRG